MAPAHDGILAELSPEESQAVLRRLLERHPALRQEAAALATSAAANVDRVAIAEDLFAAVQVLGLEDLSGRAGRHAWGYVEPGEAAWELLEEVVSEFQDEVARLARLGLEEAARAACEGALMGLYRLRGRDYDLLVYADDFPAEAFGETLDGWLRADGPERGRRALAEGFVAEHAPEWGPLVARVVARAE